MTVGKKVCSDKEVLKLFFRPTFTVFVVLLKLLVAGMALEDNLISPGIEYLSLMEADVPGVFGSFTP